MISRVDLECLQAIPEELKTIGRFVAWRYEYRGEGRKTKIPYNPVTGRMAAGQRDYTTYRTAVQALNSGYYDGLGIGLFNGLSGIDIDHCIDGSGEVSSLAQEITKTMDCYTEYSPSLSGYHLLFVSDPFNPEEYKEKYKINNRAIGVEVYPSGVTYRYLTITGKSAAVSGFSLVNKTVQLQQILDRYMLIPRGRETSQKKASPLYTSSYGSAQGYLSDSEVIEKASRSKEGQLFQELWAGHWKGRFPSQSEGDFKLMKMLAYWTGKDSAQMDRLFRQSELGKRGKYTGVGEGARQDYRPKLIRDAIAATTNTYNPEYRSNRNRGTALSWDSEIGD